VKSALLPYFDSLKPLNLRGGTPLVVMDNSDTHDFPEANELFQAHGIQVLWLPPDSTDVTQPLDQGPFLAFQAATRRRRAEACIQALLSDDEKVHGCRSVAAARRVLCHENICAGLHAVARPCTIVNGFKVVGLVPLDLEVMKARTPAVSPDAPAVPKKRRKKDYDALYAMAAPLEIVE